MRMPALRISTRTEPAAKARGTRGHWSAGRPSKLDIGKEALIRRTADEKREYMASSANPTVISVAEGGRVWA